MENSREDKWKNALYKVANIMFPLNLLIIATKLGFSELKSAVISTLVMIMIILLDTFFGIQEKISIRMLVWINIFLGIIAVYYYLVIEKILPDINLKTKKIDQYDNIAILK